MKVRGLLFSVALAVLAVRVHLHHTDVICNACWEDDICAEVVIVHEHVHISTILLYLASPSSAAASGCAAGSSKGFLDPEEVLSSPSVSLSLI